MNGPYYTVVWIELRNKYLCVETINDLLLLFIYIKFVFKVYIMYSTPGGEIFETNFKLLVML
jgi:hypothetical protein